MLSAILTWTLWSYQPNVGEFENKSTEEVLLSSPKDIKEIVKIDQIVFTFDGTYYGTSAGGKIDTMMNEISNWQFGTFRKIPIGQIDQAFIMENHDSFQILYPSDISSELFASIYQPNGDFPTFHFNQILIDFEHAEGEYGIVYFISQESEEVYAGRVLFSEIDHFKNTFINEAQQFAQYFPHTLETEKTKRTIYLPKNGPQLEYNQYLIKERLDSDDLKNALFSDPSLVQKSPITTGVGTEFTDGQNLLRENTDSHTITYIDPSEAENEESIDNKYALIRKSVDFVNDHGGWTDEYRFVGLDEERNAVHFRIYGPNGYPVFGENNPITKLEIEWSATGVSRYKRNNFSLGHMPISQIKTLDSGYTALEKIQAHELFEPSLLQDIKVGYKMIMNGEMVSLEPGWFYLYDGEWQPLDAGEMGGTEFGLETD